MMTSTRRDPPYRTRRSRIHGTGAFATRSIRKGARIDEYVGERISHDEADRRHSEKDENDSHTFLFTLDKKTVLDATTGGNESRFINHSCEPNCEVTIEDGRIFIYAAKAIAKGAELLYDYNIGRSKEDPPNQEQIFACRCGTASCRGTMLEPLKKAKPAAAAKSAAVKKRAASKKKASAKKAPAKKTAKRPLGKTAAPAKKTAKRPPGKTAAPAKKAAKRPPGKTAARRPSSR